MSIEQDMRTWFQLWRPCQQNLVRGSSQKPQRRPLGRLRNVRKNLLSFACLMKSSNFRISFGRDYIIHCSASTLDRGHSGQEMFLEVYRSQSAISLMDWIEGVIRKVSGDS